MNKNQKIILAIFIPIIILFITLLIANSVGYTVKARTSLPEGSVQRRFGTSTYHEGNPFDWGRAWYIWVLSLIFCCIFEYKLFADKKKKDNK